MNFTPSRHRENHRAYLDRSACALWRAKRLALPRAAKADVATQNDVGYRIIKGIQKCIDNLHSVFTEAKS